MAYSTSNPPALMVPRVGGGLAIWAYSSADAIAAVDATDYFSNASDLGMATGDVVYILDTGNDLTSAGQVTVDADGNGTVTAFTAFP